MRTECRPSLETSAELVSAARCNRGRSMNTECRRRPEGTGMICPRSTLPAFSDGLDGAPTLGRPATASKEALPAAHGMLASLDVTSTLGRPATASKDALPAAPGMLAALDETGILARPTARSGVLACGAESLASLEVVSLRSGCSRCARESLARPTARSGSLPAALVFSLRSGCPRFARGSLAPLEGMLAALASLRSSARRPTHNTSRQHTPPTFSPHTPLPIRAQPPRHPSPPRPCPRRRRRSGRSRRKSRR